VLADPDLAGVRHVGDLREERLPFGIGDLGYLLAPGAERERD
jgi:hypothetical protein